MKLPDPGGTVDFTPPFEMTKPEEKRAVYTLKVPSLLDRIALKRAIAARGGRQHGELTLLGALEAGVRAAYGLDAEAEPTGDAAHHIGAIKAYRERLTAWGALLITNPPDVATAEGRAAFYGDAGALADMAAALLPLSDLIAEAVPRYAQMRADDAIYPDLFALEAARKFVVGWRNLPFAFARGDTGIGLDLLERLPPGHLAALGARVQTLLAPTETEAKNSVSPSHSSISGTTSPAASTARPTARRAPAPAGT